MERTTPEAVVSTGGPPKKYSHQAMKTAPGKEEASNKLSDQLEVRGNLKGIGKHPFREI